MRNLLLESASCSFSKLTALYFSEHCQHKYGILPDNMEEEEESSFSELTEVDSVEAAAELAQDAENCKVDFSEPRRILNFCMVSMLGKLKNVHSRDKVKTCNETLTNF